MGVLSFPVVAGAQVTKTDTTALHEPGTIMMVRNGTSVTAIQYGLVKYVRYDVATNKGDVLVWSDSSDTERVEIASTTDGYTSTHFRGIAAATVAASSYGWMYIHAYCPFARFSTVTASGVVGVISGSTAGRIRPVTGGSFNATWGVGTTSATTMTVTPFISIGAASNSATAGTAVFIQGIWG